MSPKERAYWLADKIGALGDYAKEAAQVLRQQADALDASPSVQRDEVIEECARVCDGEPVVYHTRQQLATAIRALKGSHPTQGER